MGTTNHRSAQTQGGEPVNRAAVQEGYARWAPSYDRDLNPLLALEARHLPPLLPRLAGKRVLDLCCGTGRWSTRLLALGAARVTGVDFSRPMLARANAKPNLRGQLAQADCRALPFPNRTFDLVLCSFALGHVHDLGSAAREVARVTRPEGDVYVSDLHPAAYAQGWKTAFRDARGRVEIPTWPHSIPEQLAAWGAAGFRCGASVSARLGELDKSILAQAGKVQQFEKLRQVPAIHIFHFKPLFVC